MKKNKKESTDKGNDLLDRTVAFRMSSNTFAEFEKKLMLAGVSRSEFFREVFINNNVSLIVKSAPSREYKEMLFLFNKASNNLNQVARQANVAKKSGLLSDAIATRLLQELVQIRQLMLSGLRHAD